jgi:hypothetical protein
MVTPRLPRGGRRRLAAGLAAGCVVGTAVMTALGAVTARGAEPAAIPPGFRGLRDVLHVPPLLVVRGKPVDLRFDAVCEADPLGAPCTLSGSVFVRVDGEHVYRRLPLQVSGPSLGATIPAGLTSRTGFTYYAVVEDGAGEQTTVPAGGSLGPNRAWTVARVTSIDLGGHAFGATRAPDGRAVRAPWGEGADAFGLAGGRVSTAIGPSAFDVDLDGSIVVLDQVNHRLLSYAAGDEQPLDLPIAFDGGEGDLTVGEDGTTYVLDHGRDNDVVRFYSPTGASLGETPLQGPGADMLRASPGGVVAHGYPGDMWFPARNGRVALAPAQQVAGARAGRSLPGGVDVVVHAAPSEALFALVRGGDVLEAWRVGSTTSLGEVQLAEPFGPGLLVVLRVWTESQAEFVALVLRPGGLTRSFAIDSAEWAEMAPLGRFRLQGRTLYQFRSSPTGAEIATFDLGGDAR